MTNYDRVKDTLEKCAGQHPEQRRFGKTYAAVELAKKVDGLYLTFSHVGARQVSNQYQIEAGSLYSAITKGLHRPIIIDQDAMVYLALDLIQQLEKQQKVIDAAATLSELGPYDLLSRTLSISEWTDEHREFAAASHKLWQLLQAYKK